MNRCPKLSLSLDNESSHMELYHTIILFFTYLAGQTHIAMNFKSTCLWVLLHSIIQEAQLNKHYHTLYIQWNIPRAKSPKMFICLETEILFQLLKKETLQYTFCVCLSHPACIALFQRGQKGFWLFLGSLKFLLFYFM